MNKKEFAGNLLSLLREGKHFEVGKICEAMDFCSVAAQNDRAFSIPAGGYSKKDGDVAIENGEIAREVLIHLDRDDLNAAKILLKQYAA